MIVADPAEMPVTSPVELSIDAIPVPLTDQVPPDGVLVGVIVLP